MLQAGTKPLPGFDSPVLQSQRAFRSVLDAFAHPGRVETPPAPTDWPEPLFPTSAAICLALADFETPVWLDGASDTSDPVRTYLRFHCGCAIAGSPDGARFAVVTDPAARPRLDGFALGTDPHPEGGATVIVQTTEIGAGFGVRLSGPGIERSRAFAAEGIDENFWRERQLLDPLFPRGIDLIFADPRCIAAVPRSTRVEV